MPTELAALVVMLAAGAASEPAESPDIPSRTTNTELPASWGLRPPGNALVPAAETAFLNVGLMMWNRYVFNADYARTSWQTVASNFRTAPDVDHDDIMVNFLGHPYQGALAFEAARSTGLDFWESLPYTIAADFFWEWVAEVQPPSTNDLIQSGIGGPIWGEVFHRISGIAFNNDGPMWPLEGLLSFAVDPFGTVNYRLLGVPAVEASETYAPWHAQLFTGGLVLSEGRARPQVFLGADMSYGFGPDGSRRCLRPFDTFDLRGAAGFVGTITVDGSIRGVVAGCRFAAEPLTGTWGLYALEDFYSAPGFRVSSTSLGPGIQGEWSGSSLRFRATVVAAGIAMGASGSIQQTDWVDPEELIPKPSLYAMGPGALALADVELTIADSVALRATGRSWWIAAVTPVASLERVDVATFGIRLALPSRLFVGSEASIQRRLPDRPNDSAQWGWTANLVWGVRLGDEP